MTECKKQILVVEDHPIFRLGLRELINQEPDMMVCGEAKDAHTAWHAVQTLRPDLVIADITLEDGDGIEFTKQIKRHYRELAPMERLTDRELEVFSLIGQGLNTRDIASRLNISVKTIGTYRERIKVKLGLKNAIELLRHAVNWSRGARTDSEETDL
ncbi:response regulator transcription factor [Desulfatitalea tepidiphila]|uniref:response regulator transcription factor n=1 Tax=Desulfatitalea tepidiphila TaxID=1185843 RepID=UPI0006B454E7|nr:response regulator transcription factor [Desulfatitalea tepidiphila]